MASYSSAVMLSRTTSSAVRIISSVAFAWKSSCREENKSARSQRVVPIVIPRLLEVLQDHDGDICPLGDGVRRQINRICVANGLPEVGLHGLRRSFASLAYHLGWSEEETMRHGGWNDWKTVHDFYLRLSEKDLSKAARKMRRFYSISKSVSKKGSKNAKKRTSAPHTTEE